MTRKTKRPDRPGPDTPPRPNSLSFAKLSTPLAAGVFAVIACAVTFPLVFRLNSSVYGFYDHVSTDLFASIHYYFWWMRECLGSLSNPLTNPLFTFPFGARMFLANFTGFLMAPFSLALGHLAAYNLVILANLVLSALGMFLLVRHLTGSAGGALIAGIAYGFCTNMLVRSYTTFDSTQVQWIPFYTLYLIRFLEDRSWKHAVLAGAFLAANILFSMPYYLVYLPVHTIVLLFTYAAWKIWGEKNGGAVFFRELVTPDALRAWGRISTVFAVVVVLFFVYYKNVIGGGGAVNTGRETWNTEQLAHYSLQLRDYFVPHPRSALLKGDFKATYWDVQPRPEKNADSDVAYIGFIAFLLALYGLWKGRGPARWFFLAGAMVAFWATLGPFFSGLPTPSRLIYLYAPFARRILLYKTFVQFGAAGLAGMGAAFALARMKPDWRIPVLAGASMLMLAEYAVAPPFLLVDLTAAPPVYERVKALPEKTAIIEVPMKRAGGNLYQGYVFYQTVHHKPLFNPYADMALSRVPDRIRPFYRQMETPLEAGRYENLAALRFLGVTHLVYHPFIGTATVQFLSFAAPDLDGGSVPGLKRVYECPREMGGPYKSPYDYTFGDLHEITAEPCPAALVFNAQPPFDKPSSWTGEDGMLPFGLYSAVAGSDSAFVCPVWNGGRVERILRKSGCITAVNLSDRPLTFDLSFAVRAETARTIELSQDGKPPVKVSAGPDLSTYTASGFTLPASGTARIEIRADGAPYDYLLPIGKQNLPIRALAAFSDFRVTVK